MSINSQRNVCFIHTMKCYVVKNKLQLLTLEWTNFNHGVRYIHIYIYIKFKAKKNILCFSLFTFININKAKLNKLFRNTLYGEAIKNKKLMNQRSQQ